MGSRARDRSPHTARRGPSSWLLVAGFASALAVAPPPVRAADPEAPGEPPATRAVSPESPEDLAAAAARAAADAQADANRETVESQKRVEQLDDETQDLLAQYRREVIEAESHDAYSRQLEHAVASQNEELQRIEREMSSVEATARDVLPMTARLVDTLEEFVGLDLPFQLEERRQRIASLRELLKRADLSISEKYRRVVEAYQIELEYGRTLESYDGFLGEGDARRNVQFLRVGRVALLYQTLDGAETGYWNADEKGWVVDDDYASSFQRAARVANKQSAPDLVTVPVRTARREQP